MHSVTRKIILNKLLIVKNQYSHFTLISHKEYCFENFDILVTLNESLLKYNDLKLRKKAWYKGSFTLPQFYQSHYYFKFKMLVGNFIDY